MESNITFISPKKLVPHPKHDYYHTPFEDNEDKYEYVKTDILVNGISHPIYVQQGTNLIIDGHMRTAIALEIALERVPVIHLDVSSEVAIYMLISENNKRQAEEKSPIKIARQLHFIKETKGIPRGMKKSAFKDCDRYTAEEIAKLHGLGWRHARLYLKLIKLIPGLQALVDAGIIGVRGGSLLADLPIESQGIFLNGMKGKSKISEEMIRAFKNGEAHRLKKQFFQSEVNSPSTKTEMNSAKESNHNLGKHSESGNITLPGPSSTFENLISITKEGSVSSSESEFLGDIQKTDAKFSWNNSNESPDPIDTHEPNSISRLNEALNDLTLSEFYQEELFYLKIDKYIRAVQRIEMDISSLSPFIKTSEQRELLTRLCLSVQRVIKIVKDLQQASE